MSLSESVVLIPVYRPGPTLPELVRELRPEAAHVLVVDDGSGPEAEPLLATVAAPGVTVLRHPANRGKGAALKTGFRHAMRAHPGRAVVCADADGQHHAREVRQVAARVGQGIVLGVREFDSMPARSRFGNTLTRLLFHAVTSRRVADTQTGLRAYPAELLDRLCGVPGDRFEYEMNVLLEAARSGLPIDEVPVATTYLDDNSGSHFSGVSDSVRIYRPLLRYALTTRKSAPLRPGCATAQHTEP